MANPLLQNNQINQFNNSNQMNQFKFPANINPMQAIADFVNKNPQFQSVFNRLKSGENPKDIFFSLCKETGMDPMGILNNLR